METVVGGRRVGGKQSNGTRLVNFIGRGPRSPHRPMLFAQSRNTLANCFAGVATRCNSVNI